MRIPSVSFSLLWKPCNSHCPIFVPFNFSFTVNSPKFHPHSHTHSGPIFPRPSSFIHTLTNLPTISMATPWASCTTVAKGRVLNTWQINLLISEFYRVRKHEKFLLGTCGTRKSKYLPYICIMTELLSIRKYRREYILGDLTLNLVKFFIWRWRYRASKE